MYAIIESGGKQYRVKPGDTLDVDRLASEPGDILDLSRVLLVGGDGAETRIGSPVVTSAVVKAEVVEHGRGPKIIVFRFKAKARYRRKTGHRSDLTRIRIQDIVLDGAGAQSEEKAAPKKRSTRTAATKPASAPASDDS